MCQLRARRFAPVRPAPARRVWAVAAVHGQAGALAALHDALWPRLRPGDRLVYLGNYTGWGEDAVATLDELLAFRRALLARDGWKATDLAYLRGGQEEMWTKVCQIQFAPDPGGTLAWMLKSGLAGTLASYGLDPQESLAACRGGVMEAARWTARVLAAWRAHPGHEAFAVHLSCAAYTQGALFVHAGLDPARPLEDQGDALWWGAGGFAGAQGGYDGFAQVVRGYDPQHGGVAFGHGVATIDAGCGFGGPLAAAAMTPEGEIEEML